MGTTKKSAGGSRPVTKADLELDDPKRNMALVIKRMKQIAKEDTNGFEKMGIGETLARLEQSEKVAASVEAAHATEMTRKRALLSAFVASGTTPPAPATRDETPTQNVSTNVAKTATANDGDAAEEMTDEQTLEMAKGNLRRRRRTAGRGSPRRRTPECTTTRWSPRSKPRGWRSRTTGRSGGGVTSALLIGTIRVRSRSRLTGVETKSESTPRRDRARPRDSGIPETSAALVRDTSDDGICA